MATLDAIFKYGVNNRINGSKYPPGHLVRKAEEMQTVAEQAVAEWRQRREVIVQDNGLTEEGKARELKKIGAEMHVKLKVIDERILSALARERASLAARLNDSKSELSQAERETERETRDLFRGLGELERLNLFQESVAKRDFVTVKAVLNAPPGFPLLSAPVLKEGRRLLAELTNPAVAEELADFEVAEQQLRENYNDVTGGIENESGSADGSMRARLERASA